MNLLRIDDIIITDFSETQSVTINFHQERTGTSYYRLKCEASPMYSSYFPTTYLYLGSFDTVPDWNYTQSFTIESVKDENFNTISFESLFTAYPDRNNMRPKVTLQSSASSSFSSITSSNSILFYIRLVGENFLPAWVLPTWADSKYSNPAIALLTLSNQKGVQKKSQFDFQYTQATPKYGASIEEYTITMAGGYSASFTPAQLSAMSYQIPVYLSQFPNLSGDVTTTFKAIDTRGFEKTFTAVITIIPYKAVYLNANNTHRRGQTRSTVLLDFSGTWYGSPLALTCNGIYAYEGSTLKYTLNPSITASGATFSYKHDWDGASFDVGKAYKIIAEFTDGVSTVRLEMPIPTATPAISVRYNKVGINNSNNNLDYELDVVGTIGQNHLPVFGYGGAIGDASAADLNDYVNTGYYYYDGNSTSVTNFPSNINAEGILEVVSVGNAKIQRFYNLSSGLEYIRTYNGSWRNWG